MSVQRFRGVEDMPPLPRATGEDLARRIRAVWRRSRLFAGRPRNWRGVRRFRTITDASNARERTNAQSARAPSTEELALIASLLPAADWSALFLENVKSARIFDDPWKHGSVHAHIDPPRIEPPRGFYTRKGVDRLGGEVELALWLTKSTLVSLHCFRLDAKPFAGYPSIESLGELKIQPVTS